MCRHELHFCFYFSELGIEQEGPEHAMQVPCHRAIATALEMTVDANVPGSSLTRAEGCVPATTANHIRNF